MNKRIQFVSYILIVLLISSSVHLALDRIDIKSRMEQDKEREELESAGEHVEHQNVF